MLFCLIFFNIIFLVWLELMTSFFFLLRKVSNLSSFSFLVCDDTCREVIIKNEILVCTISGHCFDRLLSPSEMEPDAVSLKL